MADMGKLVQLIQLHTHLTDPKEAAMIEDAVATAWAYLGRLDEWWFLEQPTPYQIAITPGTDVYDIDRDDVGLMLHVANDKNRRIWVYKSRRSYQKYLANPTWSGDAGSDTETSPNVAVFTLRGLVGGKPRIQVRPIPNTAQTGYLHYQEAAVKSNIGKLPEAWSMVLFHLAMSMLANPKQVDQYQWKALTSGHLEDFYRTLEEMKRHESGAIDDDQEIAIDPLLTSRVEEINDLDY